jgi:hypothetical protein
MEGTYQVINQILRDIVGFAEPARRLFIEDTFRAVTDRADIAAGIAANTSA